MDQSWKKIYESPIQHRAEIVKSFLENEGIASILLDKTDSYYKFGHYEVMVNQEDVLRSIRLIEQHVKF